MRPETRIMSAINKKGEALLVSFVWLFFVGLVSQSGRRNVGPESVRRPAAGPRFGNAMRGEGVSQAAVLALRALARG